MTVEPRPEGTVWQPDLHGLEYQENPAPTLQRLRAEDPVHRSRHGYWFLTRYRDVKSALRDSRFSSDWSERRGGRPLTSPFEESDRDRANRNFLVLGREANTGTGRFHRQLG